MQRALGDVQFVLDREGKNWLVYYYESGLKENLRRFSEEDEACRALLQDILNDRGVPRRKQM